MKLRPHHLLCTKAFRGKGYSEDFVENMKVIVNNLQNESEVEITFSTDDICSHCPNMVLEHKCVTNSKVCSIDNKVIQFLELKEGKYKYKDLQEIMRNRLDDIIIQEICYKCEWYLNSNCKDLILQSLK